MVKPELGVGEDPAPAGYGARGPTPAFLLWGDPWAKEHEPYI